MEGQLAAVVWVVVLIAVTFLFSRRRRSRHRVGPAAAGAIYDLLNEDKRKAVEIVVEQRAEARDPETRDGNLPDLEHPAAPDRPPR